MNIHGHELIPFLMGNAFKQRNRKKCTAHAPPLHHTFKRKCRSYEKNVESNHCRVSGIDPSYEIPQREQEQSLCIKNTQSLFKPHDDKCKNKKKNQPIVMHSPLIGAMLKGYTFFDEQYKNILNKR